MNEDLKKLLDHSFEYATELLRETGESYPFAAYIDTIGNVHPLEMEIDSKNVPRAGKVTETLKKYCEEELSAARMKAYALAYEVKIQLSETESTDAIAIEMIHGELQDIPVYYIPFTAVPKDQWIESDEDFSKAKIGEMFAVRS